jgi:hypothetical protein
MPGPLTTDAYGHLNPLTGVGSPTLTAAANGVTTAGTIAVATAGAGSGSSVVVAAGQTPNDARGTFNITGAGTPAAGNVAVVNFSQPYAVVPTVLVELTNASGAVVAASAASVTVNGFSVNAGAAISASAGNTCNYLVIP